MKQVNVKLDTADLAALNKCAKRCRMKSSDVIRHLIRRYSDALYEWTQRQ